MRWFVEISPMGTKAGQELTLCVEAPQWQPALQKARALRGDSSALSNFSIELLDEGYRAIDPMARLRYIVKRAPDNAALTNGQGVETSPSQPPKPAAEPTGAAKPAEASKPAESAKPAESPKPAPEAAKPAATSPAAETKGKDRAVDKPAEPAAPAKTAAVKSPEPEKRAPAAQSQTASPKPSPRDSLPSFIVIGSREDNPSESSPLTYREYVYAVAQGTSEDDAQRLIAERFGHVHATLDPARSGKLVRLAVFDHIFQGRPQRRPIVTLSWKDWTDDEPELQFPQREAQGETPTPIVSKSRPEPPAKAAPEPPPASKPEPKPPAEAKAAPKPAAEPEPPAAKAASKPAVEAEPPAAAKVETAPAAPAPAAPEKVVAAPPAAPRAEPVEPASPKPSKPPAPEAAKSEPAKSEPAKSEPAKSEPAPKSEPARKPEAASKSAPAPAPRSTPAPKSAARAAIEQAAAVAPASERQPPASSKRYTGDELLSELFEAFGDLHFAHDSLEGAEFVLNLTLEKLPSEVGLVSLFDMNKREFVVVRQVGGAASVLCARQPEKAPLALSAMRRRHAIVVSDAEGAEKAMDQRWRTLGVTLKSLVCAPIELSGRYLGVIELANPKDGHAFNEGDGNALTYIGQQFAEFVAARGVLVDDDQIRGENKPPAAPEKSGAGAKPSVAPAKASPGSVKKGR